MYSQAMISSNIRRLIQDKGVKQCYIAERAGFDEKTFSNMVNGRKTIRAEYIPMIAEALEVPVNALFEPNSA